MPGLAEHTARNLRPILEVLRLELQRRTSVLEIGSGSGQHATAIGAELDHLVWQTSDRRCNYASIQNWLASANVRNVKAPIVLDVLVDAAPERKFDAVFSANTAHIMSETAVENMFVLAGAALRGAGIFCLYGPFRQNGQFNAGSNAEFHTSLVARDSSMGIRDLEALDAFAGSGKLKRTGLYSMPANNLLAVWTKEIQAS